MMDIKGILEKMDDAVFEFIENHPKKFILIMGVVAVFLATLLIDIILFFFKLLGFLFHFPA